MLRRLNPFIYFSGNRPASAIKYIIDNNIKHQCIFNYFIEANKVITPERMYYKYNNLIKEVKKQDKQYGKQLKPTKNRIALKFSSFNFDKQYINLTIRNFIDNNWQVIIDAENNSLHNNYIILVNTLIYEYNKLDCNIIKTYQMYRKDTEEELERDLIRFRNHYFGTKIVRGAYLNSDYTTGMLFTDKYQTDFNYNEAIKLLIKENSKKSINIIATHNTHSIKLLNNMIDIDNTNFEYAYLLGLLNEEDVNILVSKYIPKNIYLPYGEYRYMIPYLIRRYIEVML
jgi:hypothetical protein